MRILFVSVNSNPLATPKNGDTQRTRLLYEACSQIANVDVISLAGQEPRFQRRSKLRKWLEILPFTKITFVFPVNPSWEATVDDAIRNTHYDYIVARYFNRAIACGLWKYHDRLIIDFDDALPFLFLNQIEPSSAWTTRLRLKLASQKAKAISKRAVKKIHAAFFAKKNTALANRGIYLPNIPFYGNTCPDADLDTSHPRVLFVGQLEYEPNREGLDYFLEQVYLPLYKRLPNVEMHIVGLIHNKSLHQRWESYPNVTVTGFVDDLSQEYTDCQVVVIPIRRCGATNIKLLEAMAMNRACIATREVFNTFEGQFADRNDLYVADNVDEFVDSVYILLTNNAENRRIAQNAQKSMKTYYSFEAFADIIKSAIQ